ncbi:Type II secretory pathway component [Pseudomonas lopnurensis]|uniref:Type II secretory pathway component n=1 Tax=Pseudomonas lopnurensis TaxID=1477517 RepID=UPI0038B5D6A6
MSRLLHAAWLAFLLPTTAFALDPTRPPAAFAPASAEREASAVLRLQAIVRTTQVARAVINGASLRVGDRLADARVVAINPNSVLIERDGQRQLLRLAAPVITPSQSTP